MRVYISIENESLPDSNDYEYSSRNECPLIVGLLSHQIRSNTLAWLYFRPHNRLNSRFSLMHHFFNLNFANGDYKVDEIDKD